MATKTTSTAGVILSQIALWGIRHTYGVPGDAIIPLLDAVQQQEAVRFFAVRHESAAAIMASAEAKLTSRIGVCMGTSGPGLANMLNGIADAAADHIPMLVITGQVPSDQVGTEAKQYIDQQQLIQPLTVYSAQLQHPDAAVTIVNKAIIEALTKKGPAHISIPKDVLALPCPLVPHPPTGLLYQTRMQNLCQLDACINAILSSRQPVIYIGRGSRGASAAVQELAERLDAGIIDTLGAKGTVPADHPLYIGGIGEGGSEESAGLLKQADCLLMIGANWYPEPYVPREIKVIKIDTVPANIESQQDIAFGLVGDAEEVVKLLLAKIPPIERPQWLQTIREAKERLTQRLDRERQAAGPAISPQALMAALEPAVAANGIIALDTGDHTIWFNRIFRAKKQTVTFSGKWRTMGYGLPAAISAKLHHPNKEVTALIGDGSFMMTSMELSTLVKYETPLKIIIANSGSLASEKSKMITSGITPFGTELTNPDFAMLAGAYGIKSIKVQRLDALPQALREMYADDQTVLLDVHITDPPPSGAG